jgi:hypothetical protein
MGDDAKEASRKYERRAFLRFTVPGAVVSWKTDGKNFFSEADMPLADISRGGLAFLSNNPPVAESDIFIQVFLPQGKEYLELLGRVVYSIPQGPGLVYGYRIGVQVKAFLQTDSGNGSRSLKVIESFEEKYANRKED